MRALFIGLGGVGQRHLRNLKAIVPDVNVAAVRTLKRSFEISDTFQADMSTDIVDKYGIRLFNDLAAALSFEPDLAVVANPTASHLQTCRQLVEADIPVFLEKPISADRRGLDELVALVRERKVLVAVGYQLRQHPCVRQAKSIVDEGQLGKIFSVEARVHAYMPNWHPYETYRDFYASQRSMGGGVVLTEIHELDLITWMIGMPKRVSVMGGRMSDLDMDVEDTVCAVLEFERDNRIVPATLKLSFVQRPVARFLGIYGEHGSLNLDIPNDSLVVSDNDLEDVNSMSLKNFDRNKMFVDELTEFIECVRAGGDIEASLVNCMPAHCVALSMLDSLDSRQTIEL